MHNFAGGLVVIGGSYLAGFVVIADEKPSGAAVVPIVAVIVGLAALYWMLTTESAVKRLPFLGRLPGAPKEKHPPPMIDVRGSIDEADLRDNIAHRLLRAGPIRKLRAWRNRPPDEQSKEKQPRDPGRGTR
jgi:hypothetical protein